ncbi:energy transducer TonB [Moritella viscosa]|uniref:TonB protein n=1 Tax=Moritella viscosa TaxID=80854 RepID=A0A090ICY2_9GAMM|nr:energy transducer TonB [Moritella viscosa]CED58447.1 TonB protein [Moritella viscosa]SGY81875.1 TonB protein [Moritella viscosa]SGY82054.1 TonB protein [Moritella viscosa]SGY82066.1 TonB protein [Moritella viscosa]SGY82188.1 TonB protein [Moritella viscosa]
MNMPRYIIAGGVALASHAALLFVVPENKAIIIPSGANTTSVSINFFTPSVAQSKSLPEETVTTEAVIEPPKPVEKTKPKVTPPKTNKKVVDNAPKKIKKQPKKDTSKMENEKKEKATNELLKDTLVEEKPKKSVAKPAGQEPEIKPQAPKKGISNKPILINKPSFLSRPTQPRYPRMASRRGIEGVTIYEVWLDDNGSQIKQILISSSGELSLDKAALRAIKKWRFSPYIINGRAIAHRIKIPVRFKLDQ